MSRIGICQLRKQVQGFVQRGVPIKLVESGMEGLRVIDTNDENAQLSPRGATPTVIAEWIAAYSMGYLRCKNKGL